MGKKIKKIVLAYSGGLDTSVISHWLQANYQGAEIIAMSADVGQGTELDGLEQKALSTGASKVYIEDLTTEFVEDFIFPTLKAGAKYEGQYLLGTAFARPLIAKRLLEIAQLEGADAIAHGCTGKGNDQVRFELGVKAFDPDIEIIAPWRIWDIKGREDAIEYAQKHNIPLKITKETNYSKDKNIWHLSHEGLDLEDPANEPKYDEILELGVSPEKAPDLPEYVTIDFNQGIPVALDGVSLDGVALVTQLNQLGGKHGIGILDMLENRLVGMKCRGIYETPGGSILYHAHQMLESLCLDKQTQHYKAQIAIKFGQLVYDGLWYTPLRESLSAFVDQTQKTVTGTVKLKLYKGNIIGAGMTSKYSLYSEDIVTFGEDQSYNQMDSAGFIKLFGLPLEVKARMDKKNKQNKGE
ncbi:MAG: argininosuccinate synthase [Culicoidibacterales bacterium]